MKEIIVNFLMFLGSITCHQLDSRSFFINGLKLPYCARDTGIYFGFFVKFMYLIFRGRLKADKPLSFKSGILVLAFMFPMVFDGMSSYLGVRETNNLIRLITGLLFGSSLPYLLIPLLNFKIKGENNHTVVQNEFEMMVLACTICILGLILFVWQDIFYLIPAILTCVGMLTFLWLLIYTPFQRNKKIGTNSVILFTIGTSLCVLFILWAISYYMIRPLLQLWVMK